MFQVQTFLGQQTSVTHFSLNYHPKYENLAFKPSSFSQRKNHGTQRSVDTSVRNSLEVEIDDQILTNTANQALKEMMTAMDEEFVVTDNKWKLLKYQNGHFLQHCDSYRAKDPLIHFGAQIWLPPKTICSYQGGILRTKDKTIKEIVPSETQWTFIVLPLGVFHQVIQVIGTRISYVKPIYIRAFQTTYYIPWTIINRENCSLLTCPD